MSHTAPQIGEVLTGEAANVSFDFQGKLDAGETLVSVAPIEDLSSSDMTIDQEQISTSALDIDGVSVPGGMAVVFRVTPGTDIGDFTLEVTATTSAGQTRKGRCIVSVSD